MTKPSIFRYEGHNYLVPFLIISSLFFMWGFAHGILEVLNPHFQESFHISKAMSADAGCCLWCLLHDGTACRMDYPEMGLQEGCDNRSGSLRYRCPDVHTGKQDQQFLLLRSVAVCDRMRTDLSGNECESLYYGTGTSRQGGEQNQPVAVAQWYRMDCGTAGWRSASVLGCQHCHSLCLGGYLRACCGADPIKDQVADPRRAHEADTNEKVEEKPMRVMAFGFGMLALFLYVAAQTGVNSFFINYAEESIHIEKQTASLYLAFGGMGLFFIGRLAGGVIMNYIQPRLVLLVCAILTFIATLIVVVCSGTLSLIAFFALYLGESIMFPTIFSLALRDAGTKTKLASSLLIMTIVGGAVAPVIMGYIADTTGSMAIAFLIPLVCYGVIGTYAATKGNSSIGVKRG